MDVVLPVEKAAEPHEQARQPEVAKDECQSVKDNTIYKDVLSQPPRDILVSHKQKLLWLQQRRTEGLWAQCDDCDRWRYLPHALDRHELPAKWYCWMNPDKSLSTCSEPEVPICLFDEDDLIHAEYAAGSIVLARMPGFPWWPAMVCDCPDTEQYYWLDGFSDIPTYYNVVFFDTFDVSRAWIAPDQLTPYKNNTKLLKKSSIVKKYKNRLDTAIIQANDAAKLPVAARLAKYSFIARYKGNIMTPKKIEKQDIVRYRNMLKREFSVDFNDDSSEEEIITAKKNKAKRTVKKQNERNKTVSINNNLINIEFTESTTETSNKAKDINSLTVEIDNDSALQVHSNITEASNMNKGQETTTTIVSESIVSDSLQTPEDTNTVFTVTEDYNENSDDFDF